MREKLGSFANLHAAGIKSNRPKEKSCLLCTNCLVSLNQLFICLSCEFVSLSHLCALCAICLLPSVSLCQLCARVSANLSHFVSYVCLNFVSCLTSLCVSSCLLWCCQLSHQLNCELVSLLCLCCLLLIQFAACLLS